jgi:carboxypeptidase C (cathepsin A)
MFGLFLENGPLRIAKNGTGNDDYIINLADGEGSWLDAADLVFVDQPVGTGFSYGNSFIDRMADGTTEFINFLAAFIRKYPEYKTIPIILSGESYAGKYLP